MATASQLAKLEDQIKKYRLRYLMKRQYREVDESATRIMINCLLTEVLGYQELEDIKTEYQIRGEYADYVIQLKRKKWFVIEVKSIQLDLNAKHLRQSLSYAANEGIDWIILTNGKEIQCYRVQFTKPIQVALYFSIDLSDLKALKSTIKQLWLITKRSILINEIEGAYKQHVALSPVSMARHLYSEEVARYLRRCLKKEVGVNFNMDEILGALANTISTDVNEKLRLRKKA